MKSLIKKPSILKNSVETKHYVYLIECINNHYYTGYTTDIERRYKEHQKGTQKCSYTRSFPPKRLVRFWCFDTKSEALKEEARIKKLTRSDKIKLVNACTFEISSDETR